MAEQRTRERDNNNQRDNNQQDGQYQQRLITVTRTAKVVAGGRTFRFSAWVVIGDGTSMVGYGQGKAKEVQEAIRKATEEAKKNMIRVQLTKGTIYHELRAHHGATEVIIRPSPQGSGIIAGGPMRAIFEVLGIQNISAKCYGSTTAMNVIHATFKALAAMKTPFAIAQKRGIELERVFQDPNSQPAAEELTDETA